MTIRIRYQWAYSREVIEKDVRPEELAQYWQWESEKRLRLLDDGGGSVDA